MTQTKDAFNDLPEIDELPSLFDASMLGRSLKEVAIDVIETEASTLLSRWFQSSRDVELFIWVDSNKRAIKHQITLYGQVVEWNMFEGTKTGVVVEEEVSISPTLRDVSETIQFDQNIDQSALGRALSILDYIEGLNDEDRAQIKTNLNSPAPLNQTTQKPWHLFRRWLKRAS